MFERFTEKAIKVVMLSQEESRRLGHNFVGTEQILLGLLGEGTGLAFQILRDEGLTLKDARMEIERIIGRGSGFVAVEIPFTPRAKRVLENSIEESRDLGHGYIGTEHILLALLEEDDGVAWRLFEDLQIDVRRVRANILLSMGADAFEKDAVTMGAENEEEEGREYSFDDFTTNLTSQAKEGQLDPVVGRSKEIERVIQILVRRKKNNPVLIGEPGVGKTAVAEGLAQAIVKGEVPSFLAEKEIIALDIGLLLAGTKYRGEFEDRLKRVMDEVQSSTTMILVIDEVHNLIGAGAAEGAVDAANILKPALARGELQCIGATTIEEYRKHIEKDPALERRFQPVKVPEPTVDETIQILRGLRSRYERHHQLRISDGALIAAAKLGSQFIADRFLPDKAIDLIDEASARVRLLDCALPDAAKSMDKELRETLTLKDSAISSQKFEDAAVYHEKEVELRSNIASLLQLQAQRAGKDDISFDKSSIEVEEADIAHVVSAWTGIPVTKVSKSETEKLIKMEELLHERVIGQEVAVEAIARAIRRARVGLKNPNRPIASFIFSGPTGVGKTELTKALAAYFFDSEDSMVRLDMSEYMERHNIAKLIGSPPGYVGFSEGGFLTEQVRRKPYTVVLFDEVEKAHPDVFNLLLQILEDGRLTDSQGRLIDFKNTVIILTSNIGAKVIEKDLSSASGMGFDSFNNRAAYSKMAKGVQEELKQYFRPEFLNRLDEIIVFQQLTQNDVRKIADIMIAQLVKRVKSQGINLTVSNDVKDKLSQDGFDPVYGARPLRRVIMSSLEDRLANTFLEQPLIEGTNINVNLDDDRAIKLMITGVTPPKKENSEEDSSSLKESEKERRYSRDSQASNLDKPLTYAERAAKNRRTLLSILEEKKRKEDAGM